MNLGAGMSPGPRSAFDIAERDRVRQCRTQSLPGVAVGQCRAPSSPSSEPRRSCACSPRATSRHGAGPDLRRAGPGQRHRPRAAAARCPTSVSSSSRTRPGPTGCPRSCPASADRLDANELRSRALNWTDALAARTGESARVAVFRDGRARGRAPRLPRPAPGRSALITGSELAAARDRAGQGAAGLRPGSRAQHRRSAELTSLDLPDRSPTGVALYRELAAVRDLGWAAAVDEAEPETADIAAPVRDRGGYVVAAGRHRRRQGPDLRRARPAPARRWSSRWCAPAGTISRELGHGRDADERRLRRRPRPGHHLHPVHACSTTTAGWSPSPSASTTQHYPAAGLGGARRRRDLVDRAADHAARRSTTRAGRPRRGRRRSASPTSARRWSSGTGAPGVPVHRAIVWQDTRTARPAGRARRDRRRRRRSGARAGLPLVTYFSAAKLRWLLDADPGPRGAGGSAASCCSARWTPGSPGTSPAGCPAACTSPT